jgi:hypothetical protein
MDKRVNSASITCGVCGTERIRDNDRRFYPSCFQCLGNYILTYRNIISAKEGFIWLLACVNNKLSHVYFLLLVWMFDYGD